MNSEATGEVMNSDAEASEEAFVETLNEVNIEANEDHSEEGSGRTRLVDELLEASNEEQRSEHQHATSAGGCTLYTGF
jgi:hypothetical protein